MSFDDQVSFGPDSGFSFHFGIVLLPFSPKGHCWWVFLVAKGQLEKRCRACLCWELGGCKSEML